jgi:hypothetical protein
MVGLFKGRIEVTIPFSGATNVVEITRWPAGALQTWVGFTLENCKKLIKPL